MVKVIFNTKIQKLAVGQSDQMCQRPKDVCNAFWLLIKSRGKLYLRRFTI